jgi:uncharacterized protein involved in exopolysaccharide biosynthesis
LRHQEKGPLQLIYERLYVVVIASVVAVAAAWLIAGSMNPVYRSQARCFMPTKADVVSLTSEETNLPDGPRIPMAVEELQASLLGVLRGADLRQQVAAGIEGRSSLQLEKNVDFAIDKYNLVTISVYDNEAAMAQRIAQTFLKSFRDRLDETTKSSIRENADMLEAAAKVTLAEVERVERARQEFLSGQGTVDYATQFDLIAGQVKAATQKVDDLNARLASMETGLDEVIRQRAALPDSANPEAFVPRGLSKVSNPALAALKERHRALTSELALLKLQYVEGPNEHVALTSKRTEVGVVAGLIAAEEERIAGSEEFGPHPMSEQLDSRIVDFRTQISSAQAERRAVAAQLVAAQLEFQKLPEDALKLEDFNSELSILKQTLSNQRTRLAEFELYLKRTSSFLVTAETPSLPVEPWFPNMPLIMVAAALLGLVFSITAAVAMAQVAHFRQEALW